jgi:hypothetical protein
MPTPLLSDQPTHRVRGTARRAMTRGAIALAGAGATYIAPTLDRRSIAHAQAVGSPPPVTPPPLLKLDVVFLNGVANGVGVAVAPGQPITLTYVVLNFGGPIAQRSWFERVYFGVQPFRENGVLLAEEVVTGPVPGSPPFIPPVASTGGAITTTVPAGVAPGSYFVTLYIEGPGVLFLQQIEFDVTA